MSAYRYSTWHGYWVQMAADDTAFLVFDPQGKVIAKARNWQKAMWFALDAGNAAQAAKAAAPAEAQQQPEIVLEPDGLPAVRDGSLWDGGREIPTPSEESFFAAIGVEFLPPQARTEHAVPRRLARSGR